MALKNGWFLTPLQLQEMEDGSHFKVLSPLVYCAKPGTFYEVPAGTVTDFASVPRVLWNILPPFGKHSRAAVLHDWLYQAAPRRMTRGQADALFCDAMRACGVGWLTRRAMYAGVRVGGGVAWRRYRGASPTVADAGSGRS